MSETILVTGANRGIGLELVRQYAEASSQVLACCRDPDHAEELQRVAAITQGRVTVFPLEVTNSPQIKQLATQLKGISIDILLNVAGVIGEEDDTFGDTDETLWLNAFLINTVAPLKIMEALTDNVAASTRKVMAVMSSKMGSMTDNGSGAYYVYRSTKAALNAVMKSVSIDLRSRAICAVILHPGWVKTDMGGAAAAITPRESVLKLRRILGGITLRDSGSYFDIDGTIIPW
jgi:NAD(P)-dependent dehydrogenase (short-subunit alcohol dehydrogenase family)